ncbi:hypothetical protein CLG96_00075 [Sphingomonas oleivorans]|uniref:Uncharacterized protein n=1 Tax=Sphingomonas oleivorans TaxID=1735121 RepID=A0A2T5G3C6_9SPHN|nr:hypothetical protein CLG96_00075 [Sphingomonas oleivorans]
MLGRRNNYLPETQALLTRMTVQPTVQRAKLYDDLIRLLKSASVWAKLDALWLFAAHDTQAALLNLKGSSYGSVPVNSPAFTIDRGYQGNGTSSYLDTGWSFSSRSRDDAAMGFWARPSGAAAMVDAGDSANGIIYVAASGSTTGHRINAGSTFAGAATSTSGHFISSRTGPLATDNPLYINGVVKFAQSNPSVQPATSNVYFGRGGGGPYYSARPFAAGHVGAGLNALDVTALYAAISTYMTAVGAQ